MQLFTLYKGYATAILMPLFSQWKTNSPPYNHAMQVKLDERRRPPD
jgi:hypothetical protein